MMIRIATATVLIAGFALLIFHLALSGDSEGMGAVRVMGQSSDCQECHPEVYAEWEASWHAMAWRDPFVRAKDQADNFKKKDCIPCHAPRPIFERGYRPGERVVERVSSRDDGVDCISCHKLPEGGFAASRPDAKGPCGPVYHPGIQSVALCAPCHNQHDTVDEWLEAPPELKRESCNDCHMPEKQRPGRKGSPPRAGKDHTFLGGHSVEFMKTSFTLSSEITPGEGAGTLKVRLVNDKAGHNLPTDSRHRALDLVLTFYKAGGLPFPAVDAEREYGQEPGTHRMRFRNPYRSETGKGNTQIPAGEEAVLEALIPKDARQALIQVIYKLTPFMKDEEGFELARRDLQL